MFTPWFLLSLLLLMLSLIASALLHKFARITGSAVLVFACTSILLAAGMAAQKAAEENFSFVQPYFLLLLAVPAVLLAAHTFWSRRFRQIADYPLTGFLQQSFSLRAAMTRALPLGLALGALCLFIIALARPVSLSTAKLPPTQGIDIMMIIDVSASMNNQDFYPSRLVAAQKTAIDFIGKRFNDRIGLVIFARYASLSAPLTLDHEAVQELVASLFLGAVDPKLTAIGDALGLASSHLKNSTAKSKIILLLTDGSNNAGALDPLLAAKAAAAYGIKIYAIATASPPGTSIFSSSEDEIDEGLLMEIAKNTGGKFYRAKNEMELQSIYNEINQLEKTDFAQSSKVNQQDVYRPFLLAGLILLLLAVALRKLIFIKVP